MIHFAHFMISYQMAFIKILPLDQNSYYVIISPLKMDLKHFPVPVLVDYYTW